MRKVEEQVKRNADKMEASTKCVMKLSSLEGVMSFPQRSQLRNSGNFTENTWTAVNKNTHN